MAIDCKLWVMMASDIKLGHRVERRKITVSRYASTLARSCLSAVLAAASHAVWFLHGLQSPPSVLPEGRLQLTSGFTRTVRVCQTPREPEGTLRDRKSVV